MTLAVPRRGFLKRAAALVLGGCAALARASTAAASEAAGALRRIAGRVIRRGDPNYELWRASMVWYRFKPERRPELIVRARSVDDVAAALAHARAEGLRVTTRSTGHNPARAVLRDGGMLLDLSQLREVRIDPQARSAWIEPGIRSEELIALTRPHGLAFPAAHTGIVGLGGYLLGGGLGWNMPEWDIACRSIRAAEIVLADGSRVIASADSHPDLLWAVRGAGPGFFGAVVRYQVELFPAPRTVVKTQYLIPVEHLPVVLEELERLAAAKPRRVEILAVLGRFHPPGTPQAERHRINCVVSVFAFARSREDAREVLAPFAASRLPGLAVFVREPAELSWPALYAGQSTDHSSPDRTEVSNVWTDAPGEVLTRLAERLPETASQRSFVLSAWGVNPRKDDADSAYTYFADHYVSWYLIADGAAHLEPNRTWMEDALRRVGPLGRGHYINEIDPLDHPEHVRECFTEEKWRRLQALREAYDPDGVFFGYLGDA